MLAILRVEVEEQQAARPEVLRAPWRQQLSEAPLGAAEREVDRVEVQMDPDGVAALQMEEGTAHYRRRQTPYNV